jgi:peptidoglycan/LPS O-acetylase OafA/YrhL
MYTNAYKVKEFFNPNLGDKHTPQLDGIRAFAALLVIASHTNLLNLRGTGGVGVWVFFVLSGYLLSRPFVKNPSNSSNGAYLLQYYIKRIKRILPVYYFSVLLFALFDAGFFISRIDVARHLVFMSVNGHLWSIQQEMLFYLLLPLIAYIQYLLKKYMKVSNLIIALLLFCTGILLKIFLSVDVFYLYANGQQLPFRIYVFMIGVALSYFEDSSLFDKLRNKYAAHVLDLLSVLIIAFFIFSAQYYQNKLGLQIIFGLNSTDYIGWSYPILYALLTCVLIINLTTNKNGIISSIFSLDIIVYIGRISYCMYLIHPLFINLLCNKIANQNVLFLVVTAAAVIVSSLMYRFIDYPITNMKIESVMKHRKQC